MKNIAIIDTTLRDGHQSLWATRMTTAHMLPVIERMDNSGFHSIDLMGAIQFDVAVRYLKEDPWERVRLVHSKASRTPFRALIRSKCLLSFDVLPDDIVNLWIERLYANGFRIIGSFDGLNDVDNIAAGLIHAKRLGASTFGCLAFCESPVHTDALYVEMARELIRRCGVDSIMLKDAGGLLTVDRIRTLVPALRQAIGTTPLELHSHCLTGLAPLVYLEAVKLGVDRLHTSIKPLANGAGQPATQTIVRNLRKMGYQIGTDDELIGQVSDHFYDIARREGKPIGVPAEYDAFHYEHQIPGGMLSNFKSQLAKAGLSHKFDELLQECAQVRRELAWPIMITPFAQIIGTQAVLNVIHRERYRIVPDEVKKYVLGYYGKLLGPVDPNVFDRIVANGSKAIAITPTPSLEGVEDLRKKYPGADDDERLLRYMFAGSQVDDMRRARPGGLGTAEGASLINLLKELGKFPKAGRVHISKAGMDLTVGCMPSRSGTQQGETS